SSLRSTAKPPCLKKDLPTENTSSEVTVPNTELQRPDRSKKMKRRWLKRSNAVMSSHQTYCDQQRSMPGSRCVAHFSSSERNFNAVCFSLKSTAPILNSRSGLFRSDLLVAFCDARS